MVSLVALPILVLLLLITEDAAESDAKVKECNTHIADEIDVEVTKKRIETLPAYSAAEVEMLALIIYQEAGGDACCDECRRRVADVVLNRIADERFPDTMYEVLTQERQYGRLHWTGLVWPERSGKPEEAGAVERAYRIAREVLEGQHSMLFDRGYIWQAEFRQGADTLECCGIYYGR